MYNIRLSQILSFYTKQTESALMYFESKKDNRDAIVEFYTGKINRQFVNALKTDDDCFFAFTSYQRAINIAESTFPTYAEIVGEYGDDTYFIEVTIYDEDGNIRWSNNLRSTLNDESTN